MSDEMQKQYEEDYCLEHISIGDISYYDEEEKKFFYATLTLFGHSSELLVYDEDFELSKRIKSITSKDSEVLYEVLEQNGESVVIQMENETVYLMSNKQFTKLENFYNQLNQQFIQERLDFTKEIEETVQQLQLNIEVNEILNNFIDNIPTKYFVDPQLIAGIEYLIERESSVGRLLLITDSNARRSITIEESEKEGSQTKFYRSLKRANEIMPYMSEHFILLVKLLDKKVGFSTYIHGIFGVYRLLYYKTIEFHAKIWERGFGQFFLNIDSLSFEESIIVYSNIDSINHKSLISAGVFLYYLIYNNKIEHKNYILSINNFLESLDKALDEKKFSNFEKRLTLKKQEVKYTIEDIDIMDGKEFEEFIALLFSKLGYLTEVTKSSGDQGIDIIAEKNGKKIGIQAKCYSHSVTNTAVQEVVAGKNHYNLDKVIVVTNNYFTKSAIELAESNNVVLWDRNILKEKITEVIN